MYSKLKWPKKIWDMCLNSVSLWILRRISDMVCIFGGRVKFSTIAAAYISLKHAKCRFSHEFMWTWWFSTVIFVSIKSRLHKLYTPCNPNRFWNVNTNILYANSILATFFSPSRIFRFLLLAYVSVFNVEPFKAIRHPTNEKHNPIEFKTIRINSSSLWSYGKKEITICNNKKIQTTVL